MAKLLPISTELKQRFKDLGIKPERASRPPQLRDPDGENEHHVVDASLTVAGQPPLKLRLQEYFFTPTGGDMQRWSFSFHLGTEYSSPPPPIMRFEVHGAGPHAHVATGPPLANGVHAYTPDTFQLQIANAPADLEHLTLAQFLDLVERYLSNGQVPLTWV